MGTNVSKEKKQFEKEIKEIQNNNLLEEIKEKEEIMEKNNRNLRQMNIIIYSKNKISDKIISIFCEIKNLENCDLYGINIKIGKNPQQKEYLYKFIENGNEEKLKAISKDIIKDEIFDKNAICIDNVIVTISDDLMSPEIDELLYYFSKIPLKNQPFYLHLTLSTKEPNIKVIYNKISNYVKMDKRNFYALKYEYLNDNMYLKITNQINKFFSYYNELGDINVLEEEQQDFTAKLNILVCGRAGAGKSTLINKILDEKRCREGSGLSVTHFTTFFSHYKYPLQILDTPGFEDDKSINNVIGVLKKLNKSLKESKNQIHLIFYLFQYGTRTFLNKEINILKELTKFGCLIFFIVSKSKFRFEDERFEDQKLSIIQDVKSILKDIDKGEITRLFGNNFCDLENNYIFSINCKKEKKEEEEFGLNRLFVKAYQILEKEIIPFEILESLRKGEEKNIEELISKYKLFNCYKSRKDIILNAKNKAKKKILKFAICSPFLLYAPSIGKADNYQRIYLAMVSSMAKVYARKLTNKEALKLVNENLDFKDDEIKTHGTNTKFKTILMGILSPICFILAWETFIVCSLLFGSILGIKLYKLGKKVNKKLSEDFEKKDIPFYLFKQSLFLNIGINSLKELSFKFKENNETSI